MLGSLNSAGRSRYSSSASTNDPFLLPGVDGRSLDGRRYRDIVQSLLSEYGAAAEPPLIRALAQLRLVIEREQAALISDDKRSLENLVRLENVASRRERDLKARTRAARSPAAPAPLSSLRSHLSVKHETVVKQDQPA